MKKGLILLLLLALCSAIETNAQNRYFKRDTLSRTTPRQQDKAPNTQRRSYLGDSLIRIIPRYQGEASVGCVFMDGMMGWGIQTTHGRRTSDLFYTGFGLGVDLYYYMPQDNAPYPIVMRFFRISYNARWYLLRDKPVQLMLNLNAGLGTGTIIDILPFTAHTSIGVGASYKVSPRSAINAMLAYDYILFANGGLHGLSLRVGFQF